MEEQKIVIKEQDEYSTVIDFEQDDVLFEDQENKVGVSNWFVTICYLNIPIFNIIYLFVIVLSKKTPQPKKTYAIAFMTYQFLTILLAIMVLYYVTQVGADFLDNILKYIE